MELSELQLHLTSTPAVYVGKLLKDYKPYFKREAYKHYDVIFHDVMNKTKRPDKIIIRPTGDLKPDGSEIKEQSVVPVNRIGLPFQKFIVETLATFLTGGKVDFKATPTGDIEERMLAAVKTVWQKNKLYYKNSPIAETMMSQTEVAELWFTDVKIDKNGKETRQLKMKVLRPSDGFELQPFFDGIGNMIAFGIRYRENKIDHYDLYTDEEIRRHIKDKSGIWVLNTIDGEEDVIETEYGKIPIIYYQQLTSEWYDVQPSIERLERMQSNHADTNDYTGSPILFIKGNIKGFAAKGEPGKILEASDKDANAEYLLPDTAPESVKMEFENLKAFVHLFSGVPDLSLQSLKGLGQIPSGAAFERLLIATYMKVRRRQVGDFGEAIQRRNNFLIAALPTIDPTLAGGEELDISMDWGLYSLSDLMDKINAAIAANGGKAIISQEESVAMAGLTDDPDETFKKIQAEEKAIGNVFDNPINQ